MRRYFKHKIHFYWLANTLSIIAIVTALFFSMKMKKHNIEISEEIHYMSAKIAEQESYLKIFKSELALATRPASLATLYKLYYKKNDLSYRPQVVQIKQIDKLAIYYSKKKVSQLTK